MIRVLFSECTKIEEAFLVVSANEDYESESCWLDIIKTKFEEVNSTPLKQLELRLIDNDNRLGIKRVFQSRWQKNLIKICLKAKCIVMFSVF
jgi:hypothetical protein